MRLLGVLILGAGCKSTTVIDEHRIAATHIATGESIVVLGRRSNSEHETEDDFIRCVGENLTRGGNPINVVPEKTFVDSMYPYFETSTAPTDVKNLERLAQIPEIKQKFQNFGVRYFVWIDGFTETVNSKGSISCAIGPGGGGCFGFATWDDEANYEASIWDFKELTLSGKINTETQGTSFLPAIFIPVPLLARVQSNACQSMAQQLRNFLN
ncbi:MAG: hypothetical protein HYR49_08595 [Gammaproteobacteria bacterium]|nr:hypothetical protein [Gammaproteobacteria bacterium]